MTMNPCCLDSMPSACNTSALIIIIVTCVAIASWYHDFMETQKKKLTTTLITHVVEIKPALL